MQSLVDDALRSCGAKFLCDETAIAGTRLGPVEIIGLPFTFPPRRKEAMARFFGGKYSKTSAAIRQRIVLLHDPGAFIDLPADLGALVFSGHTHGGHIGLYSFGLHHCTLAHALLAVPDNGIWCSNGNVLYVHRGQGARSLFSQAITRLGVPSEDSVLRIELGTDVPSLPVLSSGDEPRRSGEVSRRAGTPKTD